MKQMGDPSDARCLIVWHVETFLCRLLLGCLWQILRVGNLRDHQR